MSEDYRKQIEIAVQAAHRDEGKFAFSDEDAKGRIGWHLAHNFVESLKDKGTEPVSDGLFKLLQWASYEYCLDLLRKLRYEAIQREQASMKKGAS